MLHNKKIVLGITGGIAAYKSCFIVRNFIKHGARVDVVMTESAQQFVTPLTLETLSGNPVTIGMFGPNRAFGTFHIEVVQAADLVVVAPATYNILGKVANGIADDFLSTAISAVNCPVFFAPAMNSFMFDNPIMQENLARIRKYYKIIMPAVGDLACGYSGQGRMAEPEDVVEAVEAFLQSSQELAGKKVLISAGPTREKIDPVRFISNYSSGKMGFALAAAAQERGADVTIVSGPVALSTPPGVSRIDVETTEQMLNAVLDNLPGVDIMIKSAAVADYRPKTYTDQKIKKTSAELVLDLEKTTDILANVCDHKDDQTLLVGFALETDNEVGNARQKLREKCLDLIVINNPKVEGAGFQVDTNVVTLLDRDDELTALPLMPKKDVAEEILNKITDLLKTD